MKCLYSSYVPVNNIVDVVVDEETEDISYEVEYAEGITNEVSVNLDCEDGVELLFIENNIHDELIFANNGDIILNGDVVEDVVESDYEDEVETSTGGVKWSTKKHTSKQATAYGKEGLRGRSSNVKFEKKLGAFTVGAITGIMMAKLGLGSVYTQAVVSYVAGDVASLKKSFPQSHSMSYKKYISSAIKPKKTTRYLRARYLLYGKENYGGGAPKTRYLYGTYI